MTLEQITTLVDKEIIFAKSNNKKYFIINIDKIARDIYKTHLESQLELLHTINSSLDTFEVEDFQEEIVSRLCEELENKLKELE